MPEGYANGGLKQDIYDLKREVTGVKDDINDIKESCNNTVLILQGKPNSDEPGGLIYSVSENTNFRERANKIIWTVFILVLSLVVSEAYNVFSGG